MNAYRSVSGRKNVLGIYSPHMKADKSTQRYFNTTLKSLKHSQQSSSVPYYNSNYLPPPPLPPAFIFSSGGGFLWKLIKPGSPFSLWSLEDQPPGFFCSTSQKSEKCSLWGIHVLVGLFHSSQTFTVKPNWLLKTHWHF